jgi:DNA-directed RNA polymerase specialized sigma24 family protein
MARARNVVRKIGQKRPHPRAAEVLALNEVGKSHGEIGDALGLSRGTVAGIIFRSVGQRRPSFHDGVSNLAEPNRADRLLRKFSWEGGE